MDPFNPFSLTGKTVFITGASSGIGRGIAIACSKMGADVILNGRNGQRLNETLSKLAEGNHRTEVADLNHPEEVSAMVARLPVLQGIVHCAGIGQRVLCKQATATDLNEVMDANFKGPVLLQTEILKQKKIAKAASVVFISSIAIDDPSTGNALYSASKAALTAYANCLALELAPRQIRVNSILPAMVWTDLIFKGGITEEELREDEKKYPLKRYGTPEDIANLALYLLSDASSWMTGSHVKISGGGVVGSNSR